MFDNVEEILRVAVSVCAFVSALTGLIVSFVKNCKNKKFAKLAETTNEIVELATEKVADVERMFSRAANVLKAAGVKTGEIKKESVMTYIESLCAAKKIKFDCEYWSDRVEKLVDVLNATKGA